jgi:hypothetical protein
VSSLKTVGLAEYESTGLATLSGGFFSMLVGRTVDNWGTATAVAAGFDFQGDAAWNNSPGSVFTLEDGTALVTFASRGSPPTDFSSLFLPSELDPIYSANSLTLVTS